MWKKKQETSSHIINSPGFDKRDPQWYFLGCIHVTTMMWITFAVEIFWLLAINCYGGLLLKSGGIRNGFTIPLIPATPTPPPLLIWLGFVLVWWWSLVVHFFAISCRRIKLSLPHIFIQGFIGAAFCVFGLMGTVVMSRICKQYAYIEHQNERAYLYFIQTLFGDENRVMKFIVNLLLQLAFYAIKSYIGNNDMSPMAALTSLNPDSNVVKKIMNYFGQYLTFMLFLAIVSLFTGLFLVLLGVRASVWRNRYTEACLNSKTKVHAAPSFGAAPPAFNPDTPVHLFNDPPTDPRKYFYGVELSEVKKREAKEYPPVFASPDPGSLHEIPLTPLYGNHPPPDRAHKRAPTMFAAKQNQLRNFLGKKAADPNNNNKA